MKWKRKINVDLPHISTLAWNSSCSKNAHKSALQSKNMCALFLVKRYFLISSTISCRILQLLTEPHVFTSYKRIQMHMFVQLFCSANIFLLPEKKNWDWARCNENDNAEKKRKKETVNFGSEILSRRIFLFQTLAA